MLYTMVTDVVASEYILWFYFLIKMVYIVFAVAVFVVSHFVILTYFTMLFIWKISL